MLHSKFGKESLPQKKKSPIKNYIVFVVLVTILFGVYYALTNRQRILFHIKKDNYSTIIQSIDEYEKSDTVAGKSNVDLLNNTSELLAALIKDNPTDSYLYYLLGKLYTIECSLPMINDSRRLSDIFFQEYIKKYKIPPEVPMDHWEKGITYSRKALLLELPEAEAQNAAINLLALYLIGGAPYWSHAIEYLKNENIKNNPLIHSLYKLILIEDSPDWDLLNNRYGIETTTFWMAIYYLNIRNYPLAFYNLKKLLLSESIYLRNNAYYVMGHIMGEQKDIPLKVYYHSQIDHDEFLRRNPWFLEEHNYTMRYLGMNIEAKRFLTQYEKLVLELKDSHELHTNE